IGAIAVAAAFGLAITIAADKRVPNYCLRLAYFDIAFGNAVELIVAGLLVLMIAPKIFFKLRRKKSISLIVLGIAQYFIVGFALFVAIAKGHLKGAFDIVLQISSLIWWLLWSLAVREAPNESTGPAERGCGPS
ncbi:MAG TPA: hypothetical protein VI685_17055, partial [Candidatus Angelobacter sp.]